MIEAERTFEEVEESDLDDEVDKFLQAGASTEGFFLSKIKYSEYVHRENDPRTGKNVITQKIYTAKIYYKALKKVEFSGRAEERKRRFEWSMKYYASGGTGWVPEEPKEEL